MSTSEPTGDEPWKLQTLSGLVAVAVAFYDKLIAPDSDAVGFLTALVLALAVLFAVRWVLRLGHRAKASASSPADRPAGEAGAHRRQAFLYHGSTALCVAMAVVLLLSHANNDGTVVARLGSLEQAVREENWDSVAMFLADLQERVDRLSDEQRASVKLSEATMAQHKAKLPDAWTLIQQAKGLARDNPRLLSRARYLETVQERLQGRFDLPARELRALLQAEARLVPLDVRFAACYDLALMALRGNDQFAGQYPVDPETLLREATRIADSSRDGSLMARAALLRGIVLYGRGKHEDAYATLSDDRRFGNLSQRRQGIRLMYLAECSAVLALARGEGDEAASEYRAAWEGAVEQAKRCFARANDYWHWRIRLEERLVVLNLDDARVRMASQEVAKAGDVQSSGHFGTCSAESCQAVRLLERAGVGLDKLRDALSDLEARQRDSKADSDRVPLRFDRWNATVDVYQAEYLTWRLHHRLTDESTRPATVTRAEAAARRALESPAAAELNTVMARCHTAIGLLNAMQGQHVQAEKHLDAAVRLAGQTALPRARAIAIRTRAEYRVARSAAPGIDQESSGSLRAGAAADYAALARIYDALNEPAKRAQCLSRAEELGTPHP